MKRLFIMMTILFLVVFCNELMSQEDGKMKKDQSQLPNELHVSYGFASAYLFANGVYHRADKYANGDAYDETSFGTIMIGYNRLLTKVSTIGFEFSYMNLDYKRKVSDYPTNTFDHSQWNEKLISGLAKVTFSYMNRPNIRLYSGAGIGVSIDFSEMKYKMNPVEKDKSLKPALQATLMGLRFGRQFGGFIEFGIGTNAIITGGLSVQIGDD